MPHNTSYDMFSPVNRQEASPHISPKSIETDRAYWYEKIITSEGHVVDPADYSDWGEAINDARKLLQTDSNFTNGWIRLPRTNGKVQYSTPIKVNHMYGLTGQGGRGRSRGAPTWLEYTGSGAAVQDMRGAAATAGLSFHHLRIDTDSGQNTFELYQPTRCDWFDFESNGNSQSGSVAVNITSGGSECQFNSFRYCQFLNHEKAIDTHRDGTYTGPVLVEATFEGTTTTSDISTAISYDIIGNACVWINCLSSGSDIGFDIEGGGHTWLYMFTEQAGTTCVDLTDTSSGDPVNVYINGQMNPGQTNAQFNDPNDKLTVLNVDPVGTRFVDTADFIQSPSMESGMTIPDPDANGVSTPINFYSSGNDNWLVQNRNGTLTFRDSSSGDTVAQMNKFGVLRMPNGPVSTKGGGTGGLGGLQTSNCEIYENSSGELVAVDSAGNTTTLT